MNFARRQSAVVPSREVTQFPPEVEDRDRFCAKGVDMWYASLDAPTSDIAAYLQAVISPDELERARRFYFERDRRRFLIGRGILRVILGRYVSRAPHKLEFDYGRYGKPALSDGTGGKSIRFSVAHSEGLAAYAITLTGEIGVDVERVRELPEWEQIAESYFPTHEIVRIKTLPSDCRRREFFSAWTRQEALLKARGIGLGGAMEHLGQKPEDARAMQLGTAFCVQPLGAPPGFAGALAVTGRNRRIRYLTWDGRNENGLFSFPQRAPRNRLEESVSKIAGAI